MLKKFIFLVIALIMLAGCASSDSTINIAPNIALPSHVAGGASVVVSVSGADKRPDPALAKVKRNGQLVTLTPSRDPRFLLQEALEKQMNARGYKVGTGSATDVQIIVNQLFADVSQGDLRYQITTSASISLVARAKNGNQFNRNYRASYSVEGAFQATNQNIAKTINVVLGNVMTDMANDSSITHFISTNG